MKPSVNPYMLGNFNTCHENWVAYSSEIDRLTELYFFYHKQPYQDG